MIDLVLNAAKIAISEDARKSVSSLVDFVRRSPQWQQDFTTLEAKIEPTSSELAFLLGELTVEKMSKIGYSEDSAGAFRASYTELVTNAFEHGSGSDKKSRIGVKVEITPHYVALTVANPQGKRFDLFKSIKNQSVAIARNPSLRTGRGLLLVSELADTLDQPDPESVKAVFYTPSVSFQVDKVEDLVIIEIVNGLINPSSSRRITSLANHYLDSDLVVDLFRYYRKDKRHATEVLRSYIDLQTVFQQAKRKVVILLNPDPNSMVISLMMLPKSLLAFSWDEALEKVGKPGLMERVREIKGLPSRAE